MKKDIVSVISSFTVITLVLSASTFMYQKQVYAAEQLASKIEQETQIAAQKKLERLAFIAELEKAAEDAQKQKDEAARLEAEEIAAEKQRVQEELRIAAIADETARNTAARAAAEAEVLRLAAQVDAQKKAQEIAIQIAAQKAKDAQIAAQLEAERLAAQAMVTMKQSRRSRAS